MPRPRSKKRWNTHGYDFKSRIEYETGLQLMKEEIEFEYESQSYNYTISIPHTFCGECDSKDIKGTKSYTPDFFLPGGIVIECKGRFTPAERKKHAAMKEQYPELDLRILFQRNDWITKRHKARYGDWCDAKGITWAVGMTLPWEWINDCKRQTTKPKYRKTRKAKKA